jgi:hypothetical protein
MSAGVAIAAAVSTATVAAKKIGGISSFFSSRQHSAGGPGIATGESATGQLSQSGSGVGKRSRGTTSVLSTKVHTKAHVMTVIMKL